MSAISATSIFIQNVLSGSTDAGPTHAWLIGICILGSLAVAFGIILESWPPESCKAVIATVLVISGVILEGTFTVVLFVYDEAISSKQQSKIIALETRLAPRVLSKEQFDEFQKLRGKVPAVSLMNSPQLEPSMLGSQIAEALNDAGVAITPYFSRSGDIFGGTCVFFPEHSKENDPSDQLLLSVIGKAVGGNVGKCSFKEFDRAIRTDIPLIRVGERPPFSPNGKPVSFRFRAYPGAEKTVTTP